VSELDRKASRGMRALFGRQAVVQVLTLGAGVVLARVLRPSEFGLFFIAAFLVKAVATVGDFGFAPSLIQRREDLNDRDLRAAFTLQLTSTVVLVGVILATAPWLARLYPNAPHQTVWLVRVLAFNFFLTTWRSVAFLQLERNLRFSRVAVIEVLEAVSFQVIAVGCALAGAGVWSLVCATAASGAAGTTLAYASAPWRIGFAFDRERFRALLRFGIPYQAQMILNSLGGWASMILVGGLFGPRGVGLLSWASANGRKPTAYFDNVSRVAFPHLSRQQHDAPALQRTIVRYLGYLITAAVLWTLVVAVGARGLVPLVYTSKWSPAVPALVVFAVALLFDTACILFVVALNSRGTPGVVARVVLVRSLLLAGLAAGFGVWLGIVGFAIAHLLSSIVTAVSLVRRLDAKWAIARSLSWLVVPAAAAAAAGFLVRLWLPEPVASIAGALAVVVVYSIVGWWRAPLWIKEGVVDSLPFRRRGAGARAGFAGLVADAAAEPLA
jgi:O-antigen/teichoic acid export membrane protein